MPSGDRTCTGTAFPSTRVSVLYAAVVVLITLLTYVPAINNGFVWWDDDFYVFNNGDIREVNAAFLAWAFGGIHVGNWHPLTWLSHAVDYAIWGLDPAGHHLTSVLLHCLNTLLVFLLVHSMLRAVAAGGMRTAAAALPADHERSGIAGLSSLLFGIHPVHVESVAWVSERKDVLCAFFVLVSLLWYLRHCERVRLAPAPSRTRLALTRDYVVSLIAFLFALMSKSMAVSLPVVMLLLDGYLTRRFDGATVRRRRAIVLEKIPFALASLALGIITVLAQRAAIQPLDTVTLEERTLVAAYAYLAYIGKLLWPVDLAHYHPYPATASFANPVYVFSLIASIAILSAAVSCRRSHPIVLLAAASSTVMLLPVLGIIQVGEQSMADRYLYLPSIGPLALAGAGAVLSMSKLPFAASLRHRAHLLVLPAALLACALFVPLSLKQIAVWRNDVTLWTRTIEVYADKDPRQYHHLERLFHDRAAAFERAGQFERALADLTLAINMSPDTPELFRDRGLLYLVMGMPDHSRRDYDRARQLEQRGGGL